MSFSFHHFGEDDVLVVLRAVPRGWLRIISLEMCSPASYLIDFTQAAFRLYSVFLKMLTIMRNL